MEETKSQKELRSAGAIFEEITLNQIVHSVHDVQVALGCETAQVIKTLVFIGAKPIVVIMPGDKRANIAKIKTITGEQKLRMAKSEEVVALTSYNIGSVTPFGIDSTIQQIADESVMQLPTLFLGSGKNDVLIKINQVEFQKAFRGIFASISD